MSTKAEQAAKLLNNINVEAKQVGLGDYLVDSVVALQSAVVDQTFSGNATTTEAGLMSATDKAKLDAIEAEANKYVLPAATAADLGGVKLAVSVADAAGAAPTAAEFKALLDSLRAAGIIATA